MGHRISNALTPHVNKGLVARLACAVACAVALVGAAPAYAATQVATEDQLDAAVAAGGEVELTQDIDLTKTLEVTKDVVLTSRGDFSLVPSQTGTWTKEDGQIQGMWSHDNAVIVRAGATLTLGQGAALDGRGGSFTARLLFSLGHVVLDGGSIRNYDTTKGDKIDYLVAVDGQQAKLDIRSGSITGLKSGRAMSALIGAGHGASISMTGGQIAENRDAPEGLSQDTANDYTDGSGAIIEVSHSLMEQNMPYGGQTSDEKPASFTFSGGTIEDNMAAQTVRLGDMGAVLRPDLSRLETTYSTGPATMTISGGEIKNNLASFSGGGVYVHGNGALTMTGGTISGNRSAAGGGVAVYDGYTYGAYDSPNRMDRSKQMSIQDWSKMNPASFSMTGGTITGNKADVGKQGVGGGVYVASNEVHLQGGSITDNSTGGTSGAHQGGGVYVSSLPYTLRLDNALVTNNSASELGGGLWLCPTGSATNSIKNGAALFDNTSKGAASDVASLSATREQGQVSSLSMLNRMLGNWVVNWYRDGGITQDKSVLGTADGATPRYADQAEADRVKVGGIINKSTDDLALTAVTTDGGKKAAKAAAKLVITGNSSSRGGGIGSNGNVQFGDVPTQYDTVGVKASKTWSGDDAVKDQRPTSVTVGLYEDADGDGRFEDSEQIDEQVLSADNTWSYEWTELKKYKDEDNKAPAVYGVREVKVPAGYEESVTSRTDEKGNFTYAIDNAYKPQKPQVETVQVNAVKKWVGDEAVADAKRPASVTVGLYQDKDGDGQFEDSELVVQQVLDAADGWAHTWTGLKKYEDEANKVPAVYGVREVTGAAGYDSSVAGTTNDAGNYSFTVTNTYKPEQPTPKLAVTSVKVLKKWAGDEQVASEKRPKDVTVALYEDANGDGKLVADEKIDERKLDEADGWAHEWDNLRKYRDDDQKLVARYQVLETSKADGYEAKVTGGNGADGTWAFTVTNTYKPEQPEKPTTPTTPEKPGTPEQPTVPEQPQTPQTPVNSDEEVPVEQIADQSGTETLPVTEDGNPSPVSLAALCAMAVGMIAAGVVLERTSKRL